MRVTVDEEGLTAAARAAGVEQERAQALWQALAEAHGARDRVRDVAWYGGGLLTVLACAYVLGSSWGSEGPAVGLAVAAAYAVGALLAAEVLRARGLAVPAALLGLVVVALVPVAVAAVEDLTVLVTPDLGSERGLRGWVREDTTLMALGAVVVGGLVLARYRRPFLLVPVLAGACVAVSTAGAATGTQEALVALLTAGLLGGGLLLDRAGAEHEGLWAQLAGLLAAEHLLWQVLAVDAGTGALVHGLGGLAAVGLAVRSGRRLHLAAGAVGVLVALSHLAFEVFAGSLLFPVVLALLGVAVVLAGVRLDASARAS